jgi:hypothetical protein
MDVYTLRKVYALSEDLNLTRIPSTIYIRNFGQVPVYQFDSVYEQEG